MPPVFEENAVVPRLPDDKLALAYKWRLAQVDCVNRGYVLDGYPRNVTQSKAVFLSSASEVGDVHLTFSSRWIEAKVAEDDEV